MIMARTEESRREALKHILPFQRSDFEGIFRAMEGNTFGIVLALFEIP